MDINAEHARILLAAEIKGTIPCDVPDDRNGCPLHQCEVLAAVQADTISVQVLPFFQDGRTLRIERVFQPESAGVGGGSKAVQLPRPRIVFVQDIKLVVEKVRYCALAWRNW